MAHTYTCQRCSRSLRAVAFVDLDEQAQEEGLTVYCGACTKILEREQLMAWAGKWAKSLLGPEQEEAFVGVLAAVWEQGFTRARTFEEAREVYKLEDNPFIAVTSEQDPLLEAQEAEKEDAPQYLDEDDYYDKRPLFGEPR